MTRRTIEALVAKYVLEPAIRDVFVEGANDKTFVRWIFRAATARTVSVLEIATVEVPSTLVAQYGLTSGERQRVLTLARVLEERLGSDSTQVTCVVDTDCDEILSIPIIGAFVVPTDYTSMDVYLFDQVELQRFITVALGLEQQMVGSFIDNYSMILQELFLLRAAIQQLQLAVPWVDFTRCCQLVDGVIVFDRDDFVTRLVNRGNIHMRRQDIEVAIRALRDRLKPDVRHQIYGRDFMELLSWHNRPHTGRNGVSGASGIRTALILGGEPCRIAADPMFRILSRRMFE